MVKGNLHFRAEDVEIVRALMKAGASARMQTGNTKESPIHYVAGTYICSTILKVLMKPKDETHLYLASIPATGNSDILSELLSHLQPGQLQLGVNQQSATGWSPLLFAAHKGHLAAVHILLEHVSSMIQPPKRFIESDGL